MRIVVIGASTAVGSALVQACRGAAMALDPPDFDPADARQCRLRLGELSPEAVVYASLFDDLDAAERSPNTCRTTNVRAAESLTAACRSVGCPYVHISSGVVFCADGLGRPWTEDDPPSPRGVCAETLVEAEEAALGWERSLVVRTGEVFGKEAVGRAGTIDSIIRMARRARRIMAVDDHWFSPTYAAHVARAIVHLLGSGASGLFHLASSGEATRVDVAREVVSLLGLSTRVAPISAEQCGWKTPRPQFIALDAGRYHGDLQAPRFPPWREAIREYLAGRGK